MHKNWQGCQFHSFPHPWRSVRIAEFSARFIVRTQDCPTILSRVRTVKIRNGEILQRKFNANETNEMLSPGNVLTRPPSQVPEFLLGNFRRLSFLLPLRIDLLPGENISSSSFGHE